MCDDRKYEKRVSLYYKDYDKYLIEVMKEVIPRQLASLYKYNLIIDEALKQYVNSICDVLNVRVEFSNIRKDVEETLEIKYNKKTTRFLYLIVFFIFFFLSVKII